MKPVFIFSVLLSGAMTICAQNKVQLPGISHVISTGSRWDLDKYVWSHTHPQRDKHEKRVLDFDAIDNWTSLSSQNLVLSSDGDYFVYGVQNNLKRRLDSVIVQSTNTNWRVVLAPDARPGFFSSDGKKYIFQDKAGLCFLKTGADERIYIKEAESYKSDPKKEWLAYKLSNQENTLVLQSLSTGEQKRINEVVSYTFDETGTWIAYHLKDKQVVLQNLMTGKDVSYASVDTYTFHFSGKWFVGQSEEASKNLILFNLANGSEKKFSAVRFYQFTASGDCLLLNTESGLNYVDLVESKLATIWVKSDKNTSILTCNFDATGKQVVFVSGNGDHKVIWYWKVGMDKAKLQIDSQSPDIGRDMLMNDNAVFSESGNYIQFTLRSVVEAGKPQPGAIQLDVWSYQDKVLQSAQPFLETTKEYSVVIDVQTGKVLRPERESERLGMIKGDYAIISKSGIDIHGDRFWEKGYYEDSVWLISLQNGARRLLPIQRNDCPRAYWFSPDGLYLLYFDASKGCNYFSYELATGKLVNISAGVPALRLGITRRDLRTTEKLYSSSGIKLWLADYKGFLVYDNYGDIWQLDPSGKRRPICITHEYGKLQNIAFNLMVQSNDGISIKGKFNGKDTLLFRAYNRKTKLCGFFRKVLGSLAPPERLSMDSCYMDGLCLKAENANVWIVNRQSATQAPNYYITSNFKTYKPLTNLQPHKQYNWLTAELHSFKQLDGTTSQGVLYKPENFDSSRKYPVIISFYGTLSDNLYKYPAANYITAPDIFADPSWMVSHGYMVFIPDIYFSKNQWGPSTVNTMDGAARYLGRLPNVDSKHIGAAGHSNSGRFGYYLFTHSKSFAAMALGSGFTGTDVISLALSLEYTQKRESNLEVAERSAFGTSLGNMWENKSRWIDHTAVLQADRAAAPLLLFHCDKDGDDPRAAVELFTALRRLEKRCWWLNYNNGGHRVDKDDARDWTIRYTQYFDHYLKGAPAPRWMTKGIQSAMKGIETGYELDPDGNCAMKGQNICKECDKWNHQ